MKPPSEQFLPNPTQEGAAKTRRTPILPTVFMQTPVLAEQLRRMCAGEIPAIYLATVTNDVRKKTAELRALLHNQKCTPARLSPHTLQEAEMILKQAESREADLPSDASKVHPDNEEERLCRAVDILLMLDAAIRALGAP